MGAIERPPSFAPAELAAYRDEPPQMKSGAVGKAGLLRLGFERRGERTILADLASRAMPRPARVALRRRAAGHGVALHGHQRGLRAAG